MCIRDSAGTVQNSTYVKIGQVVHIGLNIMQVNNNMQIGTGSNIAGLPFPVAHLQGVFIGGYDDKDASGAYLEAAGYRIIFQGSQSGMRHMWTSFTYRTTA